MLSDLFAPGSSSCTAERSWRKHRSTTFLNARCIRIRWDCSRPFPMSSQRRAHDFSPFPVRRRTCFVLPGAACLPCGVLMQGMSVRLFLHLFCPQLLLEAAPAGSYRRVRPEKTIPSRREKITMNEMNEKGTRRQIGRASCRERV